MDERWHIQMDMTGDGAVTISDVWEWVTWVINTPGDGLIWLIAKAPDWAAIFEIWAAFFEITITPDSYGNWFSSVVSAVFWLSLIILAEIFDIVEDLFLSLFALAIMAFFAVRIVNAWLAIAG